MFYLKRERQERAAGRSERAALEAAAATSGRSVLISGLTVMVAMSGMFLTGDPTFASFGLATMVVVAIAVLGSLTVLPALLSRLGDNVDRLRVPFIGRRRNSDGESRFWGAIVDRVLARPVLSTVLAGGLLLGLAAPALQLRLGYNGPDTLPKSMPVVKAYNQMQQAFPGTAMAATVVVKAPNVNAPAVRTAIARLDRRAHATGRVHGPITMDVNGERNGREPDRPDRRDRGRPRLERSGLRVAHRRHPEHGGRTAQASRRASPGGRRSGRTWPTRPSRSSRSSSRSCSCSRSR